MFGALSEADRYPAILESLPVATTFSARMKTKRSKYQLRVTYEEQ